MACWEVETTFLNPVKRAVCLRRRLIVIVIMTFCSASCLGQETAEGSFDLRVKLSLAQLSSTNGGGLHFPFKAERLAEKLLMPIFLSLI